MTAAGPSNPKTRRRLSDSSSGWPDAHYRRRVWLLEALELLADEDRAGLAPMPWLDREVWVHCYQGA